MVTSVLNPQNYGYHTGLLFPIAQLLLQLRYLLIQLFEPSRIAGFTALSTQAEELFQGLGIGLGNILLIIAAAQHRTQCTEAVYQGLLLPPVNRQLKEVVADPFLDLLPQPLSRNPIW